MKIQIYISEDEAMKEDTEFAENKNYSLDSDEEDNRQTHRRLDIDEIEGQEDTTIVCCYMSYF